VSWGIYNPSIETKLLFKLKVLNLNILYRLIYKIFSGIF